MNGQTENAEPKTEKPKSLTMKILSFCFSWTLPLGSDGKKVTVNEWMSAILFAILIGLLIELI